MVSQQPASAGTWGRIHRVELAPGERAPDGPEETRAVPFELWVNGWLLHDAQIGDLASLQTASGRVVQGTLVELEPGYSHSFGPPPPALQLAGFHARDVVHPAVGES